MVIDEFIDESAFDPKKLFNEEEFSTLIINREGFSNKQNTSADLIEALMEPNNTRAENEEIYAKLKEANATELMMDALKEVKKPSEKALLLTACWECGLDFSPYFLTFAELACHNDFKVAFEALTVAENCEGTINQDSLQKALKMAQESKSPHSQLTGDLIVNIQQRLA